MQIKVAVKRTNLIVDIAGELDHHYVESVKRKVDSEMINSSVKNIIFDFSNVNFMDSSGIGVIMGRYKMIQKLNGTAVIVNPNSQIRRILEMSGILKIIPVYDNMENAIESLSM
ncbi:MAG: anti-sigma F factor antagonist [Bacillota bacterium]|nr:anti-sigma F factor antagonist [Bacillota bacterium]